ncbi:hypothetical protein MUK42_04278 [Musa troglodytarum]|uniref:Uncharacterized protein n=1 Tax=Musa troglodytarum TaxID=320322 RepID=A0A9E7KHT6_9LILI|nr:hypothetical protein MUK42_04278 [Musa troglodytarum]
MAESRPACWIISDSLILRAPGIQLRLTNLPTPRPRTRGLLRPPDEEGEGAHDVDEGRDAQILQSHEKWGKQELWREKEATGIEHHWAEGKGDNEERGSWALKSLMLLDSRLQTRLVPMVIGVRSLPRLGKTFYFSPEEREGEESQGTNSGEPLENRLDPCGAHGSIAPRRRRRYVARHYVSRSRARFQVVLMLREPRTKMKDTHTNTSTRRPITNWTTKDLHRLIDRTAERNVTFFLTPSHALPLSLPAPRRRHIETSITKREESQGPADQVDPAEAKRTASALPDFRIRVRPMRDTPYLKIISHAAKVCAIGLGGACWRPAVARAPMPIAAELPSQMM